MYWYAKKKLFTGSVLNYCFDEKIGTAFTGSFKLTSGVEIIAGQQSCPDKFLL